MSSETQSPHFGISNICQLIRYLGLALYVLSHEFSETISMTDCIFCIPLRVTGKSSENECIQRLCRCGKTTPGMYLVVRIPKAQFLYPKGRMTIVFKMKIPKL